MTKIPIGKNEFLVFAGLALLLLVVASGFFKELSPPWPGLLGSIGLVFVIGMIIFFFVSHKETKKLLLQLTERNPLKAREAVELLGTYHISDPDRFREQEPYWTLISNKIYEDLRTHRSFVREFCPMISRAEWINGVYRSRFIDQAKSDLGRDLLQQAETRLSGMDNPDHFLETIETYLATLNSDVNARSTAPDAYEALDMVFEKLDPMMRIKASQEWQNIRVNGNEPVPWEDHWQALWKHFQRKSREAMTAATAAR